jgi:hypothetical protein
MVRGMRTEIVVTECTSVSVPYARPCSSSCAERRTVRSENEIQQVGRGGLSLADTQTGRYGRLYSRRRLCATLLPPLTSAPLCSSCFIFLDVGAQPIPYNYCHR